MTSTETREGRRKAAVMLLSLPDGEAKRLMSGMDENELREISRAILSLGNIPSNEVKAVRSEFVNRMQDHEVNVRGGMGQVRSLIFRTLGKQKGREILQELQKGPRNNPWEILDGMSPARVYAFLSREHPQTISLTLSKLESVQAGLILEFFSKEVQEEIILRFSRLGSLPPDAMKDIEDAMMSELNTMENLEDHHTPSSDAGQIQKVAELLNLVGSETSTSLLAYLDEQDNAVAEAVRKEMFLFEDLVLLDQRSFQKVLRQIDDEVLLKALKNAPDNLKEKFFENLSDRAAERVQEELALLPPVRLAEVEENQQTILKMVREMEKNDEIVIMGKGSDEFVL